MDLGNLRVLAITVIVAVVLTAVFASGEYSGVIPHMRSGVSKETVLWGFGGIVLLTAVILGLRDGRSLGNPWGVAFTLVLILVAVAYCSGDPGTTQWERY